MIFGAAFGGVGFNFGMPNYGILGDWPLYGLEWIDLPFPDLPDISGAADAWIQGSTAGTGITTSADLPGSTHWDPSPVPVGQSGGGGSAGTGGVLETGITLPYVDILGSILPGFQNEGQPPIILGGLPPIFSGSGGGYYEPPYPEGEKESDVALTFGNIVSGIGDVLGAATAYGNMTSGQLASSFAGPTTVPVQGPPAVEAINTMYTGSCPPRKTRTLTIDCATGQEVKRKRRRRRALLTQGDMGVLFQIASLPNNANVRVALAGAIRR